MFDKKFWIVTVLAIIIIFGWDYLFLRETRQQKALENQQKIEQQAKLNQQQANLNNAQVSAVNKTSTINPAVATQPATKRFEVKINTNTIKGTIDLQGGVIDHVELKNYKVDLSKDSKNVVVFDNRNKPKAYYFMSGWIGEATLPDSNTLWQANKQTLTANDSVVLTWNNNQGLIFKKTIALDNNYLFTVTDEVVSSNGSVMLSPYALILRHNKPNVEDLFISHEGFLGYVNNTLERVDYKDVTDTSTHNFSSTDSGFVGFTDKYWLTSIIVNQKGNYNKRFISFNDATETVNYQVDIKGQSSQVVAGNKASFKVNVFVGPKEYNLLKSYDKKLGITNLEDAIDFGWFFFFTKPMISFLLFIYHTVGSFGIAILLFTVLIRLAIFPIGYKSYVSLAKMKELQPKMKQLKELHAGNTAQYNKELMALYKKEKVNPLSGCIPVLLQIPIFFSIYKTIFVSIELRHTPFYGWIQDLSAKDPTSIFNLFGLLPFNPPSFLIIGAWPILMGVTMFVQQRFASTRPADPIQQKVMDYMPLMLVFVMANFPAGLVIYWTWSNIISIIQQFVISKLVAKKLKKY